MPRPTASGGVMLPFLIIIFEELWATLSWLIRHRWALWAFGMTTILLNPANSGLFAFDVAIPAMGIFLRRHCANFFAGLLEYKKRQHLWFNRFYVLRLLLADVGRDPSDAENGLG